MMTENGQGYTRFYEHLEHCCQLVSKTYGKPDRADWTNSDFVSLGQILFRKTGVQISPNTLKRIFGKIKTDSRYYPQKATRDALASYVGYPDWDHFAGVQEVVEPAARNALSEPSKALANPPIVRVHPPETPAKKWIWIVCFVGVSLVCIGFLLLKNFTIKQTNTGQVKLLCKNPTGETPHSAVFQVQGITDKSVPYSLYFGDNRRVAFDPTNPIINHYYEVPGRFFALLKQGSQNLDTTTVYLPTKGWTATANMMYDTTRVYPIETPNLFANGSRSISAPEAARAGIDTNRTFFIEFINAQPTQINGDNFELITRVKTSRTRTGVRCSQVGITVWGETSKHSFDVIKPGCVYWSQFQLSEIFKDGQLQDLSFLGADLRAGGVIKLQVINQRARLFINDRLVYETRYAQPLRQIYGVKIRFSGIGTVNSFSLKDLKSNRLFSGNF